MVANGYVFHTSCPSRSDQTSWDPLTFYEWKGFWECSFAISLADGELSCTKYYELLENSLPGDVEDRIAC